MRIGPPLAVGRMAVDSEVLSQDGAKGKAVFIMHTWKDHLFDMGYKGNPPDSWEVKQSETADDCRHDGTEGDVSTGLSVNASGSQSEQTQVDGPNPTMDLTKEGASNYLYCAYYLLFSYFWQTFQEFFMRLFFRRSKQAYPQLRLRCSP